MPDTIKPRVVTARRMLSLTTAATTIAVGLSTAVTAQDIDTGNLDDGYIVLAQVSGEGAAASGEGEGGGGGDPEQVLQRDMSFMEGHMRAGLELYEAGDLVAAKTHMGHPIAEKYGAVSDLLADRGFDRLRQQIEAVAAATEAETPFAEAKGAFDAARVTMEEVRAGMSLRDQMLGLAALIRVAGDEYTVAVEGGEISNLHEYQDSWGFLRVVETELEQMAASNNSPVSEASKKALEYLAATDVAFGDIHGEGEMTLDPSILYGVAARIELEALELG